MKNLFRTKFGKRVLIGGILLLAAALCGFAAVLSSFLPEPWNGLAANGCVVLFLRLHAKHKAEPDGGTPERNVDEAGVLTPSYYKKMQGKIAHENLLGNGKWQTRTVGVILRSEVYTGDLVQG